MRKRVLHVLNWDKYQARTDKDMPWCKLWGTLFDRPWFQTMPDSYKYFTVVMLDLARKTGNRITEEYVSIEYLSGNYGILNGKNEDLRGKNEILSQKNDVFKCLKSLSDNGFLSDNTSDIVDKIREDKIRVDNTPPAFDFQTLLSKYPNKDGSKHAKKQFLKTVKTEQDWLDINKALENYLSSKRVSDGYIKNASTWFGNWRDWVNFTGGGPKTLTNAQGNLVAKLKRFGEKNDQGNIDQISVDTVRSISKQDA